MKSKTLTIYGAESQLTPEHQEVTTPSGEKYFLRITESEGGNYDALEDADPKEGETVLNTVEVGDGATGAGIEAF